MLHSTSQKIYVTPRAIAQLAKRYNLNRGLINFQQVLNAIHIALGQGIHLTMA